MSLPRILVLGAGAAGLKAAARARRLLPSAAITVVDRNEDLLPGADLLPLFLSGEVERLETLLETSYQMRCDAEFFRRVKDLDMMTGWRAVALDRDAHAVTVEKPASGRRTMVMYDLLVYALGARQRVPSGFALGQAVLTMTAPAAARLRSELQAGAVASCLVVGGGCTGVQTAAALADLWACEVTLLESADRLLPRLLDAQMSRLVAAELERAGVRVRTGCAATAARTEAGRALVAAGAQSMTADRAVLALGSAPRAELARAAGLAVGDGGGLLVDANLRTSDPCILAVGDCLELVHHTSGELCRLPLGSLAARQGRVAGDVLAGRPSEFNAVVGSAAVKVMGLNVAATGLSAAAARAAELEPLVTWGAFSDRLQAHPEQALIYLQLVHEAGSGRLLGLQAVGPGEVVKRVDVFAALLRQDADLADLLDVECCGAPPYNAPLDPLNELAAIALNCQDGSLAQVPPDGSQPGRLVLDVRTAAELASPGAARWPEAVNIPLAELRARAGELPAGRPLLVVCAKGSRSAEAARILQERGFADVVYLAGGLAMRTTGGRAVDPAAKIP